MTAASSSSSSTSSGILVNKVLDFPDVRTCTEKLSEGFFLILGWELTKTTNPNTSSNRNPSPAEPLLRSLRKISPTFLEAVTHLRRCFELLLRCLDKIETFVDILLEAEASITSELDSGSNGRNRDREDRGRGGGGGEGWGRMLGGRASVSQQRQRHQGRGSRRPESPRRTSVNGSGNVRSESLGLNQDSVRGAKAVLNEVYPSSSESKSAMDEFLNCIGGIRQELEKISRTYARNLTTPSSSSSSRVSGRRSLSFSRDRSILLPESNGAGGESSSSATISIISADYVKALMRDIREDPGFLNPERLSKPKFIAPTQILPSSLLSQVEKLGCLLPLSNEASPSILSGRSGSFSDLRSWLTDFGRLVYRFEFGSLLQGGDNGLGRRGLERCKETLPALRIRLRKAKSELDLMENVRDVVLLSLLSTTSFEEAEGSDTEAGSETPSPVRTPEPESPTLSIRPPSRRVGASRGHQDDSRHGHDYCYVEPFVPYASRGRRDEPPSFGTPRNRRQAGLSTPIGALRTDFDDDYGDRVEERILRFEGLRSSALRARRHRRTESEESVAYEMGRDGYPAPSNIFERPASRTGIGVVGGAGAYPFPAAAVSDERDRVAIDSTPSNERVRMDRQVGRAGDEDVDGDDADEVGNERDDQRRFSLRRSRTGSVGGEIDGVGSGRERSFETGVSLEGLRSTAPPSGTPTQDYSAEVPTNSDGVDDPHCDHAVVIADSERPPSPSSISPPGISLVDQLRDAPKGNLHAAESQAGQSGHEDPSSPPPQYPGPSSSPLSPTSAYTQGRMAPTPNSENISAGSYVMSGSSRELQSETDSAAGQGTQSISTQGMRQPEGRLRRESQRDYMSEVDRRYQGRGDASSWPREYEVSTSREPSRFHTPPRAPEPNPGWTQATNSARRLEGNRGGRRLGGSLGRFDERGSLSEPRSTRGVPSTLGTYPRTSRHQAATDLYDDPFRRNRPPDRPFDPHHTEEERDADERRSSRPPRDSRDYISDRQSFRFPSSSGLSSNLTCVSGPFYRPEELSDEDEYSLTRRGPSTTDLGQYSSLNRGFSRRNSPHPRMSSPLREPPKF